MENSAYVSLLEGDGSPSQASLPRRMWEKIGSRRKTRVLLELIVVACVWIFLLSLLTFARKSGRLSEEASRRLARDVQDWEPQDFEAEYVQFLTRHGKSLPRDPDEFDDRLRLFTQNVRYVHLHNRQNYTYSLAVNSFADVNPEEFRTTRLGYRKDLATRRTPNVQKALEGDFPGEVDWRARGCVGPVKDQGQCGSCWAFAVTAVLEGALCAASGTLVSLSEQQLVDCASREGNKGCHGGNFDQAFLYVERSRGLCTEAAYPYDAAEETCASQKCRHSAVVDGWVDVLPQDETALMQSVATHGPVAVAIEADQINFQLYGGGVFAAPCGTDLDHAVTVVGYGTDEETGVDYWTVRNSWGAQWGEEGYVRMARRGSGAGECGVQMLPVYATVRGDSV